MYLWAYSGTTNNHPDKGDTMSKLSALLLSLFIMLGLASCSSSQPVSHTSSPSFDLPTPTTSATAPTQPPVAAPVQAPVEPATSPVAEQPVPTYIEPVQPVTVAPVRCEEDMPCWAGSANDNRVHPENPSYTPAPIAPVQQPVQSSATSPAPSATPAPSIDPYSGNPIVDCAAQGLITAEDFSCVPGSFYSPTPDQLPSYDLDLTAMDKEARALYAATTFAKFPKTNFDAQFVGIETRPAGELDEYIQSVINPGFYFRFQG